MENINRLLETSRRSDVRGTNIYTAGRRELNRPDANTDLSQWDPPSPGLPGIAAIGHHIDVPDLILPEIRLDGVRLGEKTYRFTQKRENGCLHREYSVTDD